jgi:hypothetical protein
MNIAQKFQTKKDQDFLPDFTVKRVSTKTMMSNITNPVIDFVEVRLDPSYENVAFLAFATFEVKPPPVEQWIRFGLTGRENIQQQWRPQKIKQECICIDYKKRAEAGHIIAVSHIITAKGNVLVSAQLLWFGFPFLNQFFVGIKPGMRERTEELLLAGLEYV